MDTLLQLTAYHWLGLGFVLLILEALGAGGFLLGAAVAAFSSALIAFAAPELGSGAQLALYSLTAVVATFVYFQMFRATARSTDQPLLNRGPERLIGKTFVLPERLDADDEGYVQLGDTRWKVTTGEPIAAGTKVEVQGADRMRLYIAPAGGAELLANRR